MGWWVLACLSSPLFSTLCDHVFVGHTHTCICICICGSYLYLYLHLWVILVSTRTVYPLQIFLQFPSFEGPCRWKKQHFRQCRLQTDSRRPTPPEKEPSYLHNCFSMLDVTMDKFQLNKFLLCRCSEISVTCLYFVNICVNIIFIDLWFWMLLETN